MARDWIDEKLDEIEHLSTLHGDECVAEAERLGFIVTEKGVYLNPHHPAAMPYPVADGIEMIRRKFAKHGVQWSPEPEPESSATA